MQAAKIVPTIIYEDTHLLVLDKPAGLLSQGEVTGTPNLVDELRQYLGRPYVGLVHRLDRNTSGLMVVGKRTKSAQRLTASLQAGRLTRSYLAWLEGTLAAPAQWRHLLLKDEARNLTLVKGRAPAGHAGSPKGYKEAALAVEPVAGGRLEGAPLTLARFELQTGRSHQIRAQAAFERLPLLGDRKYGGRLPFARPALHSAFLRFDHPMTGEWLEFEAVLPPDMAAIRQEPR